MLVCAYEWKKRKNEKTPKATTRQSAKFSFLVCCLFSKTKEITSEEDKQEKETCNLQRVKKITPNISEFQKKKNNNKNTKNTNNKKLKKIPKKSKQEANMQLLCTKYEFKGTKMQRGNVKLQREPSHWRLGYIAFITSLLRLHVRVCLLIRHCLVCSDVVFLTLFAILFVLCLGVFFSFDATKCNFSTLICFACVILYCRVFREFLRYSFLLWAIFAFVGF